MTPNRHFNPRLGRWNRPDPFFHARHGNLQSSLAQSGNLFLFTMNNPVRWVDPTGLFALSPWLQPGGGLQLAPQLGPSGAIWDAIRNAGGGVAANQKTPLDKQQNLESGAQGGGKPGGGKSAGGRGDGTPGGAPGSSAGGHPTSSSTPKPPAPNPPANNNAPANTGRGANHLRPDASARGAHTTYRRDASGRVTHYATWEPNSRNPSGFQEVLRGDMVGNSHYNKVTRQNVPTPHIHGGGTPGGVRAAQSCEITRNIHDPFDCW